jgi:hypothetical protein
MDMDAEYDEESDEIGHDDVSIKEGTTDVAYGEDAKDISTFAGHVA